MNDSIPYLDDIKYLDDVLRHIQAVQQNCIILGKKLIEEGNSLKGRALIQNSLTHDSSKLVGKEWDSMITNFTKNKIKKSEETLLIWAIEQHTLTNRHHPEYWGGIDNMPEIHLIEMVCDWKARATEFGTDLRNWIDTEAAKKFGFKQTDEVYMTITKYVDMLCGPPLKNIQADS